MGKEPNFLFPSKCTAISPHKSFSTYGRSQAGSLRESCNAKLSFFLKFFPTWGRVKLSSAKMQSYPSWQILPILCREGFFLITQNFYKSFPTNLCFFFFVHFFYFVSLFFSYFLKFSFQFSFLFCQTWNSSPKGKNYSPAFGANNRRIDAPERGIGQTTPIFLYLIL